MQNTSPKQRNADFFRADFSESGTDGGEVTQFPFEIFGVRNVKHRRFPSETGILRRQRNGLTHIRLLIRKDRLHLRTNGGIVPFEEFPSGAIEFLDVERGAHRMIEEFADARQADGFLGLPTPASALLGGALCCYCSYSPVAFLSTWVAGPVFVPLLTLCLCALLVCELPMFSFKFHKDDAKTLQIKRMTLVLFVLAAFVFCLLAGHHWSLAVLLGLAFYILNNLVYALFKL